MKGYDFLRSEDHRRKRSGGRSDGGRRRRCIVRCPGHFLALWPVLIPSIRERESPGSEGIAVSDLWLWGNLAQRHARISPDSDNSGRGRRPNGLPEVSGAGGAERLLSRLSITFPRKKTKLSQEKHLGMRKKKHPMCKKQCEK